MFFLLRKLYTLKEKLLRISRVHKLTLGWTITDIRGIHAQDSPGGQTQTFSGAVKTSQSYHKGSCEEGDNEMIRC